MDNIQRMLKHFFEQPTREFHIRLLARLSGLHPNTVITLTDKLAKQNLLIKEADKDTNRILVKANTQSHTFRIKKLSYNIQKIYNSGLPDFLNEQLAYPTVVLFGSYAKAENTQRSDIDLFIITEEKKKLDLNAYEKKLETSIQLFVHTKKEFNKLLKTNPELVNNVLNGIVLEGYLEVF